MQRYLILECLVGILNVISNKIVELSFKFDIFIGILKALNLNALQKVTFKIRNWAKALEFSNMYPYLKAGVIDNQLVNGH